MMGGWTTAFGDESLLVSAPPRAMRPRWRLLQAGVDVNRVAKIPACSHPVSPLTISAVRGHQQCVELCLRGGAAVDLTVGQSYTALYLACLAGFASTAHLLLAAGASPSAADHAGETPLYAACKNGRVECCELLLITPAGAASVSQPSSTGRRRSTSPRRTATPPSSAASSAPAPTPPPSPRPRRAVHPAQIASELGHADCVSLLGGGTGMALCAPAVFPFPRAFAPDRLRSRSRAMLGMPCLSVFTLLSAWPSPCVQNLLRCPVPCRRCISNQINDSALTGRTP